MSTTAIKEALKEPGLPPDPEYRAPSKIVVGVLVKFVNLGKGWKHRMFVLKGGVLRYYKIFGPARVDVQQIFEALRQEGELTLIGVETQIVQSQKQVKRSPGSGGLQSLHRHLHTSSAGRNGTLPQAQAELHLQLCKIRKSEADSRKFYIESGTNIYKLKAETPEDRQAWLDALNASKAAWEGLTPSAAAALTPSAPSTDRSFQDSKLAALLDAAQEQLTTRGATPEVQAYVADLLSTQQRQYTAYMTAEGDKRRTLLDYMRTLEDQKRQLETVVVVDATEGQARGRAAARGPDDQRSEASELSDAEPDADETENRSGDVSSSEEDTDEVWYDAVANISRRTGDVDAEAAEAAEARHVRGDAEQAGLPLPEWLRQEGPPPARRDHLPKPAEVEKSVSLWSIIKEMVGKDLTRVCLPVYFNEPLSALQKTAEDLEYTELLDKAVQCKPGSIERMTYIAAFAVSGYSGTGQRTNKPFNPLLGETFEMVYPEKGWRAIVEKVVHHPTMLAAHGEGRGWSLHFDGEIKSKFWGRSIELIPLGVINLAFDDGEEYRWSKVVTSINNLILGKLYIDHAGIMRITNLKTGMVCKLRFKETGRIMDRNPHQVKGHIEQAGNKLEYPVIHGKWDDSMYADWMPGKTQLLWKMSPPPVDPTRYKFTDFAIKLNEITPGLKEKLAPTDCRLRPDQHFLELGMYDKANQEKQRLEIKQRAARKAAEQGEPLRPRWFEPLPEGKLGETPVYRYKGGYWESRAKGTYEGCRDIFGQ